MTIPNESLIMFDLDGTLALSKSAITLEMAEVLKKLLAVRRVAIITGGAWPQLEKQVISYLPTDSKFENLFIMPTAGAKLYIKKDTWVQIYSHELSEEERALIIQTLKEYTAHLLSPEDELYGEQIEDRISQISFSALGQHAPPPKKATWDPDQLKRGPVVKILQEKLPQFEVRMGGMTTIDITQKGGGKAGGIKNISEYLHITLSEILYVGDAIYEGGNDYDAKRIGLNYIKVKDENETLSILSSWFE